jgi:diguanylate cyclase (GGDEF)-like protein/PAS domain S-box-containing protein
MARVARATGQQSDGGTWENTAIMQDGTSALSLDTLLGNLPGMVYRCLNCAGRTMEFVSTGARPLTGYAPDELIGDRVVSYGSLIHPEDRERVHGEVLAALAAGQPFQLSYRLLSKDGTEKWVSEQGNAVRAVDGASQALEGYVTDITQGKRAEQTIRESEERFKSVVKAATDAVWDWDLATDRLWWNEGFSDGFGHPPEAADSSTSSWTLRIHPEDRERVMQTMRAAIRGSGHSWSAEYRFERGDGSWAHVENRAYVIRNADGRVVRIVGGMTDLTERKQAQHEAQRAEAMQRRIIEVQREIASSSLALTDVMYLMAQRAMEITSASGSAIELVEENDMVRKAVAGSAVLELWPRLQRDDSLAGHALQSGLAVYAEDAYSDPRTDQAASRRLGVRSMIAAPLREGNQLIGAVKVMSAKRAAFSQADVNNLQLLVDSLGAVILRHHAAERLSTSELQYRFLFDNLPQPMWVYEVAGLRILAANRAAIAHYGYSESEFRALTLCELHPPEDVPELERAVRADTIATRTRVWRQRKKDGTPIEVEIFSDVIEFDGRAARVVLASDVTERRRAERDLLRVSRAKEMLAACNQALIRGEAEELLLREICRVAVEIGGYRMAWVGFAQDDETRAIKLVSHFGADNAPMPELELSWDEASHAGCGPAGRTIRSGTVTLMSDSMKEVGLMPWQPRLWGADDKGMPTREGTYRSGVWLPLRNRERTFGLLCMYAAEVAHLGQDEVKLLQSLADNLAYGLDNLRLQQERLRLQASALKVATAVSAATGTEFFRQLTDNMVDALGASAGFMVRLTPGNPAAGRTLAVVVGKAQQENFDFDIADGRCRDLVASHHWLVQDDAAACYARSSVLRGLSLRACGGHRLDSSTGEPLGVVFVLFADVPHQKEFISSTLKIFAARAAAELERQASDARIREQASLLDNAKDAIIVRGIDQRVRFWNKGAERLYGWTQEEAIGRSIEELLHDDPALLKAATDTVMQRGEWSGEIRERHKSGSFLTVEANWTLVLDSEGRPESIFAIKTDITQRKAAELEIKHLAFYDALTLLPNRLLLMERLRHALTATARTRREGALLFIDLDNFKALNDTLGHHVGDLLLQQVATRLSGSVREVDTVARLGGDEFVVMLENLSEDSNEALEQAREVGEKVLMALNQPFQFAGYEHRSTPSIGITLFGDHRNDVAELLKRADLAMYQAKAAGRNTLRFFDPTMQAAITRRVALENELRHALQSDQITLHYQPQVNREGQVTGVEALVRWEHPERGMVPPVEFIPVAEETDLILLLGQKVLQTACIQLAAWSTQPEFAHLSIAVNVSAHQFRHPAFVDQTLAALDRSGANAYRLKLELTESLLVDNMESTIVKMSALKSRGVQFSLDDFGTGYSSLFYLKRLPLDQLKIDQSFIRDVLSDPNDAAIVRTIIALGQSLGLAVIAEGVETEEMREFLAENGCYAFQGYLFGRPMPLDRCEQHILATRDALALA